jgi:hypothetical protein
MIPEPTALVKTTGDSARRIAGPANQAELEASMSYTMVVIGTGVGHLAAAIYTAVAGGLRILFEPARASERGQGPIGIPVRAQTSAS